ncbi:MAG: ABC transporter ATPase [Flavobacteriales bacterium]
MIPFETLPDESRIWIYQANRPLSHSEKESIENDASKFIDQWTSHGASMQASAMVLHHRFLIISADEAKAIASGCGIDKAVHFVQQLGERMEIDFFQRMQVCYKEDEELKVAALHQFWAMRKANIITEETLVFDNTIRNKGQLAGSWLVPFAKSWHQEMWAR